jgi:predicted transcriptional regulator
LPSPSPIIPVRKKRDRSQIQYLVLECIATEPEPGGTILQRIVYRCAISNRLATDVLQRLKDAGLIYVASEGRQGSGRGGARHYKITGMGRDVLVHLGQRFEEMGIKPAIFPPKGQNIHRDVL